MTRTELAKYIDQTNLTPGITKQKITEFCNDAKAEGFASVCILPTLVTTAAKALKGSDTKVCTVISFPLGFDTPEVKILATQEAIEMGAQEIDLVINVSALKSGLDEIVNEEVGGVARVCHEKGALMKLIIEAPLLTKELVVKACAIAEKNGVDIVKTSTGFKAMLPRATTVDDVKLMRNSIKPTTGLKAAGGIHTTAEAIAMIEAGATRIGASSGKDIIMGLAE